MSPDVIDLQHVSFRYPEQVVLRDISLHIPRGQVVAIMGGSGCGKTTLLRLIGGQLMPMGGKVTVIGKNLAVLNNRELFQLRRNMGMLFQLGGLFTDLSVFDNIAYPVREHTDLPEELITALVLMKLQAVGLRGAHALMPAELSGGMARRVALARAIVLDPGLILYDEPFAGLDPISLGVIGRLIRTLNDALAATSVIVTHDVWESLKVVDYVYLMSEGSIVAQGSTDTIKSSNDAFVRQFVDGQAEGPVDFHFPAPEFSTMLQHFSQ